jgi:hypothetical protein
VDADQFGPVRRFADEDRNRLAAVEPDRRGIEVNYEVEVAVTVEITDVSENVAFADVVKRLNHYD